MNLAGSHTGAIGNWFFDRNNQPRMGDRSSNSNEGALAFLLWEHTTFSWWVQRFWLWRNDTIAESFFWEKEFTKTREIYHISSFVYCLLSSLSYIVHRISYIQTKDHNMSERLFNVLLASSNLLAPSLRNNRRGVIWKHHSVHPFVETASPGIIQKQIKLWWWLLVGYC